MVRAHDFHPVSIAACYSHRARIATLASPGHSCGSRDPSPGQLSWPWPGCGRLPAQLFSRSIPRSPLRSRAPRLQRCAEASARPGNSRAQSDQLSIFTFLFWHMFIFNLPREPLSVYPQRRYLSGDNTPRCRLPSFPSASKLPPDGKLHFSVLFVIENVWSLFSEQTIKLN